MTLIQTMQRRPASTTPEATLRSAAKQMASHHCALLPVIARGRLVGTLSALETTARRVGSRMDPDRRTVRAVMRPDPPTCRPEDTVAQVCEQMRALRQPVLPVIEANGELVGLVDLFDIEAAGAAGSVAGPEPDMVKRVRGEAH
ncbi:CBS domain-containing protein [Thiohalocapsa sp.]|uniref:CBS domain-containing protein n=1 Tax=Thiohalocapsa sp. TaxID=2497641 RepID=UPI0025D0B233|nr:CBS domain-containing protein [Thiohalocapsa sp.]